MRRLLSTINKKYGNAKIKYKLFLLVSGILLLSFLFTIFGVQYAFHIYDEQLYSKSSQVLNTSSNSIENELKRMEDVTYNILSDDQIQRSLASVNNQTSEYERFQIRTSIIDKLLAHISTGKYIQSITLIDTGGEEYFVGPRAMKMPPKQKLKIIKKATAAEGKTIWINDPEANNSTIISTREIREYRDLSFDTIGVLVITINVEQLVRNLLEGSSEMDGEFVMANMNEVIYPRNSSRIFQDFPLDFSQNSGYQIKSIGGKNYFIVQIKSKHFDWYYLNAIPFNSIFKNIENIKTVLFFVFITMFLFVSILGMRFARSITSPLENLVEGMQSIQNGDFKEAKKGFIEPAYIREDEVGMLHTNFQRMIKEMDELIYENYSKQLTIKETEFKALQAQINPHFLYNTLESINWLAKMNNQQQISKMVEALGFLLRNSISIKEPLIPLEEELTVVSNYIVIQTYRFEERLDFSLDVHPEVRGCPIPKLTLQPLIENAIHYALETMVEPCCIRIYSKLEKESYQLIVEDNGPGMDEAVLEKVRKGEMETRGQGIGLTNIHERIQISFGQNYGFTINSKRGSGTKVIIVLPYDKEGEHVQGIVS